MYNRYRTHQYSQIPDQAPFLHRIDGLSSVLLFLVSWVRLEFKPSPYVTPGRLQWHNHLDSTVLQMNDDLQSRNVCLIEFIRLSRYSSGYILLIIHTLCLLSLSVTLSGSQCLYDVNLCRQKKNKKMFLFGDDDF